MLGAEGLAVNFECVLQHGLCFGEAPLVDVGDAHGLVGLEGIGVVFAQNAPA